MVLLQFLVYLLFFLLLLFSTPLPTPDEDLRSKAPVFRIFFMCKVSTFLWSCSDLSCFALRGLCAVDGTFKIQQLTLLVASVVCRIKPQTFLSQHPYADIVLDPRLKTIT